MENLQTTPRYKVGDKVRTAFGERLTGRVMEVRWSRFGSGRIFYTIYVPMDPEPLVFELRDDEIEDADTPPR